VIYPATNPETEAFCAVGIGNYQLSGLTFDFNRMPTVADCHGTPQVKWQCSFEMRACGCGHQAAAQDGIEETALRVSHICSPFHKGLNAQPRYARLSGEAIHPSGARPRKCIIIIICNYHSRTSGVPSRQLRSSRSRMASRGDHVACR
jgi:hypothetical protein